MSRELEEKVADAIEGQFRNDDDSRSMIVLMARAALAVVREAMAEPNEAMCRAGEDCEGSSGFGPWLDGGYEPENVEQIWRAMISASPLGEPNDKP